MIKLAEIEQIDDLIKKYNVISIKNSFIKGKSKISIDEKELRYLVECGMCLASSNKVENKKRVLDISTLVAELTDDERLIVVCCNLLNRIKNFPAKKVVEKETDIDLKNRLSPIEYIREVYEEVNNTVYLLDKEYVITDIQANIYRLFSKYKDISISAPTSIGKTFIITKLLIKELLKNAKNIVYIVPTRALINQIRKDIEDELRKIGKKDEYFVQVTSDTNDLDKRKKGVFILTQERFYQLCNLKNTEIGTIIIDEAQNITDDSRGILLEYSIRYARKIWTNVRLIFISPYIDNPDILLKKFNLRQNAKAYEEKQSAVRQNIIKLERLSRGYQVKFKDEILISKLLINRSNGIAKTIANTYEQFNNGKNSIIYCNRADNAIRVCKELDKLAIFSKDKGDKDLDDFASFIETFIHKNYLLCKYIRKGIVFHYGTLPGFIRIGIEELAAKGKFSIIACTPTLLQGVNIPVQNIYIYNPRKGDSAKLTSLDFWNLVGRAGRVNNDLSGNIILIDSDKWENINQYDNKEIKIQCATDLDYETSAILKDTILNDAYQEDDRKREKLDFLESGMIFDRVEKEDNIQLVLDNDNEKKLLNQKIDVILNDFQPPQSLLIRLLGIKAEYITNMWNEFQENDSIIEEYILVHPFAKKKVLVQEDETLFDKRYDRVVRSIHANLMNYRLYEWDSPDYLLGMSKAWIRETPLRKMIFLGFSDFNDPVKVTSIVNSKIKFLNDNIRYKLVKGMYAYQEILKEYLIMTKRNGLVDSIVNMPTFLEFGASKKVTLDIMKLGLTRELAIEVVNNFKIDENNLITSLKNLDLNKEKINEYGRIKIKEFIESI